MGPKIRHRYTHKRINIKSSLGLDEKSFEKGLKPSKVRKSNRQFLLLHGELRKKKKDEWESIHIYTQVRRQT